MKKTIATITMAVVMGFGSTMAFANGGIIVSDRNAPTCSSDRDGIIIAGRDGIIIAGRDGIIIAGITFLTNVFSGSGQTSPCTAPRTGILVSD